jgi:heat shock protein HspQ
MEHEAHFFIGQIVRHRLFEYRGVIFDVDPEFELSEEWYDEVAMSRPPKDSPWYHVLVDGSDQVTYVAERNLEADPEHAPIRHPLVEEFFDRFDDGEYHPPRH